MSASAPGRREVAKRVFAVEFDESTHSYRSGDDDRAPIYVVTPTGAEVNRLFVVGVLTELTWVNDETLRARIADPTGGFVVYAGQYQQDARAQLAELSSPAFVAVTGKANVFEPDDGDRIWTSIRPEMVAPVDADTRNRWIVNTADRTIDRISQLAGVLEEENSADAAAKRAIEAYRPTPAYLASLYDRCVGALQTVVGEEDEIATDRLAPTVEGEPTVSLSRLAALGREGDAPSPPADDEGQEPEPQTEEIPAASGSEAESFESQEPVSDEPTDESLIDEEPLEPVLDDEERAAIEDEFGAEFSTGSDIPSPEPDPDPEPVEEEPDEIEDGEEAEDVDLVSQIMEAMVELNEGSGVDREILIEEVNNRTGEEPARVEDALTEALMEGRCYEPSEGTIQPI